MGEWLTDSQSQRGHRVNTNWTPNPSNRNGFFGHGCLWRRVNIGRWMSTEKWPFVIFYSNVQHHITSHKFGCTMEVARWLTLHYTHTHTTYWPFIRQCHMACCTHRFAIGLQRIFHVKSIACIFNTIIMIAQRVRFLFWLSVYACDFMFISMYSLFVYIFRQKVYDFPKLCSTTIICTSVLSG